jgi:hypothetical protein
MSKFLGQTAEEVDVPDGAIAWRWSPVTSTSSSSRPAVDRIMCCDATSPHGGGEDMAKSSIPDSSLQRKRERSAFYEQSANTERFLENSKCATFSLTR